MILLCVNLRQKEWIQFFQETQLLWRFPNADSCWHRDPHNSSRGCGMFIAGRADVRDDAPVLCHLSSYRLAHAKMWREALEAVLVPGRSGKVMRNGRNWFMEAEAGCGFVCVLDFVGSHVQRKSGYDVACQSMSISVYIVCPYVHKTQSLILQSLLHSTDSPCLQGSSKNQEYLDIPTLQVFNQMYRGTKSWTNPYI